MLEIDPSYVVLHILNIVLTVAIAAIVIAAAVLLTRRLRKGRA